MDDLDIKRIEIRVTILNDKFDEFAKQYEIDMRGDKDLSNGNRGIIGHMRDIQRYHKECPSFIWLLRNAPFKTVGTILFVFLFLMTLYQVGAMKFILTYFGVPIQ